MPVVPFRSWVFIFVLLVQVGCTRDSQNQLALVDVTTETEDAELQVFLREYLRRAEAHPASAAHRGRLAMAYDANGFNQAAATTYRQAHQLNPSEMRWSYLESLARAEQGEISAAVDAVENAIRLDPSYMPSHLAKGYWELDLGEFANACGTFDIGKEINVDERNSVALTLGLAQCHLELGNVQNARQWLATLSPDSLTGYGESVRQRVLRASGVPSDQVESSATNQASQQPLWSDPVSGAVVEYTHGLTNESLLAQKLIEGGRGGDALPMIASLQSRHPDVPYLIELQANAMLELGQIEQAMKVLTDGLQRFTNQSTMYLNLGTLHESMGQQEQALTRYTEALETQHDLVPAFDAKAMLLIAMDRPAGALEVLIESLQFRSADAGTHYLVGVLYGQSGKWRESSKHLLNALELAPNHAEAHASLALSLSELGRYNEALDAIKRALTIDPASALVNKAAETLVANGVLVAD